MPYSIAEIAKLLNGEVYGDSHAKLNRLASFSLADANAVVVLFNEQQLQQLTISEPGLIVTNKSLANHCHGNILVVQELDNAFNKLYDLLSTQEVHYKQKVGFSIDQTAIIDPSVTLGDDTVIGAHAVLEKGVTVDDGCVIGPYSLIGENVALGAGSIISSHVSIAANCILGENCKISSGAVIGLAPFNPIKTRGQWQRKSAVGTVRLDAEVELGGNSIIERGVYGDTLVGRGCKIDSLVRLAHDVIIQPHTVLGSGCVVGAGVNIGSHTIIGTGCVIAANTNIGQDVTVNGMTAVTKNILKPGHYASGTMAQEHKSWRKNVARFHRLNLSIKRLRRLLSEVEQLKKRVFK